MPYVSAATLRAASRHKHHSAAAGIRETALDNRVQDAGPIHLQSQQDPRIPVNLRSRSRPPHDSSEALRECLGISREFSVQNARLIQEQMCNVVP
jgi:hypothetical protein